MKLTKIIFVLIVIFAALVPLSCKKSFLVQTNTFQSGPDATFNKASDVIGLVNSIYTATRAAIC